jgi:hypothetical protein
MFARDAGEGAAPSPMLSGLQAQPGWDLEQPWAGGEELTVHCGLRLMEGPQFLPRPGLPKTELSALEPRMVLGCHWEASQEMLPSGNRRREGYSHREETQKSRFQLGGVAHTCKPGCSEGGGWRWGK